MPFDLQPCLKGDLVELRPLRPEDFLDLYRVAAVRVGSKLDGSGQERLVYRIEASAFV